MDPRNEQFGLNPSIAKGAHGNNSFGGVTGGKVRRACDGTKSPESADMSSAPKGGAPSRRGRASTGASKTTIKIGRGLSSIQPEAVKGACRKV